MTETRVEQPTPRRTEREIWEGVAVRLANAIAHCPVHRRQDLAQLRRQDPEAPNVAAFWRLAHRDGLGRSREDERRWGTILQGIAIMTPNSNREDHVQSAHNPYRPLGRALYEGREPGRGQPLCREHRVQQFLSSREHVFRRNFMVLVRVLDEGRDREAMEDHVRRVYRLYYQAEYHAKRTGGEEPESG